MLPGCCIPVTATHVRLQRKLPTPMPAEVSFQGEYYSNVTLYSII